MDDAVLVRVLERLGDLAWRAASASSTGSGPRLRRAARSSPSTSSSTRNGAPSGSSSPWIAAMFGWLSGASSLSLALEAREAVGVAGHGSSGT